MKTKLYGLLLAVLATAGSGKLVAQSPGDIMFTGFNADGNDGFSFVVLQDIPANDSIWFTDEEWNGSAFNSTTSEGDVVWYNSAVTPAGTVIYVNDLSVSSISVNTGTVAAGTNGAPALGNSNETLYAYLGTQRNPSTFLTCFANSGYSGSTGVLTGTGLVADSTAMNFTNGHDVFAYDNARSGELAFSDYLELLANTANWISEDGSGDQSANSTAPDAPFDTTAFTIILPPSEGDVLFVGFNADGSDGLALVFLTDVPPSTEFWFNDNEWNGHAISTTGAFNTGEGAYMWSDTNIIPAGTVLYLSNYTTSGMTPSFGTVTPGSIPNAGYSNSGEVVYCYLGSQTAPTTFLTAVTNGTFASNGSIDSTGLTAGVNAIQLTSGADIAEYVGARSGQSAFEDYRALIMNGSNWISEDGSGDQSANSTAPDVPFNTTIFTIGNTDIVPPTAIAAQVVSATSSFIRFSEYLDSASAVNLLNYEFSPALTITNAAISAMRDTVFLTHNALSDGVPYVLSVDLVEDTAGNAMDSTGFEFVWNESIPNLVITEIIHSPNTVEMIEVFNAGSTSVNLGGLVFTDGTNGNFPLMTLASDSTVLFSTDPASASSLMGGTYYLLGAGLSSSSDILVIRNSIGDVIDSVTYNVVAPWPVFSGSAYANSIELNAASLDNNVGSNWSAPTQHFTSSNGEIYATPGIYPPPAATFSGVSLTGNRLSVDESTTSVDIIVNLSVASASAISVDLVLLPYGTATEGADFSYASTQSFTFAANTTVLSDTITIALSEDGLEEASEYFYLELANPVNCDLGANTRFTVMINDNDGSGPMADHQIKLTHLVSYSHTGSASGNSAEIVAHDPISQRLFIANSIANKIDIVDFSDPASPTAISSINISSIGSITSVAAHNGIIAASIANVVDVDSGHVVFFDTNGAQLASVQSGVLPDMVCFSHDGMTVMTANEGQPNSNYTVDPAGSVTIVDISGGLSGLSQSNVSFATFDSYNASAAALIAAGVRITGPNGTTVAQDMEPEYITISDDDSLAYVTCQENNAIAVVDIAANTVIDILPLGYKDHMLAGNALDANDQMANIEMANWPLRGLYMPDAVAHFSVNGATYLVTANEGDAREYDGYEDVQRLSSITLDSATFPQRDFLSSNIGRITVINTNGDTDNDGDFDAIYTMGARSFSIWDANGALIYDSGDDFEMINAHHPTLAAIFNASNSNNNFKNRSDDKGPEPEGVATAEINGQHYAFIAVERIGGVMVYNVTNPAMPAFVDYQNTRTISSYGGDQGSEGIIYIDPVNSPNGKGIVILANEVSSTLSVFEVETVDVETYTLTQSDLITTYGNFDINEGGFSGMSLVPGETDEFYVVGDRGPNADATNAQAATGTTLFFPVPAYAPKIHRIKAEADTIAILETMTIKRPDGTNATGVPNPIGTGGTGEAAWSDTIGTAITPDFYGIDSEGIIEGQNDDLWISDEYGASVWHVQTSTGALINRYWPFDSVANNLPIDSVFKFRRANRGFEGVTMTPNGKVYACIQSGMDNPNTAVGNNTRLLRILEIDPATGQTRMLGYELEPAIGGSSGIRTRDWKLGDMVAINNNEFLILEHAQRGAYNSKKVFKFDISNATAITSQSYGGNTFEELLTANNAANYGIQVVEKELYLDLLAAGWDLSLDKPEGLTIINDSTIAVVNDNDFGIDAPDGNGVIVATGKQTKLYIYTLPSAYRAPLHYCQPLRIYADDTLAFCEGASVNLEVITGSNYSWFEGSTALSATGSTLNVSEGGDYYAVVTDSACESNSRHFEVVVHDLPVVSLGADVEICDLETATLNGPSDMAAYLWSNSETTQQTMVSAAGTYVLAVMDTMGCENADTLEVIVNALPSIDLGNDTSICDGASLGLTATAGMSNYAWSTNASTSSITVDTAGTYSVTIEDANGCENNDTLVLMINDLPVVSLSDTNVCDGTTYTLEGPAGYAYSWSTFETTQSIDVQAAGTYYLTITDGNACVNADSAIVGLYALPVVSISGDTAFCDGVIGMLDAGTFAAYEWNTNDTAQMLDVATTGTYSVIVWDANGCENSDSIDVMVFDLPAVDAGADFEVCDGESAVLQAGGAQSYTWSNAVTNGGSFTPLATATYTVTGTDANGCENTDDVVITVNENPSITLGEDTILCDDQFVVLDPGSGYASYSWSSGEVSQTISVDTSMAGTYTVTVVDANGCEGTATVTVGGHDCLGIEQPENGIVIIYPNPTSGVVNVDFGTAFHTDMQVAVVDALGKTIRREQIGSSKTQFNLRELPNGVYFIQWTSAQQVSRVERIVVQH